MSFNKITIIGHLGKDPELRYTPQGIAVCNFSIATSEKTSDGGKKTNWFKVTLWRSQAEAASKYLTKGSEVYVAGTLGTEEWTDRDGKDRYTLTVNASEMQFIGKRDADQLAGTNPNNGEAWD